MEKDDAIYTHNSSSFDETDFKSIEDELLIKADQLQLD